MTSTYLKSAIFIYDKGTHYTTYVMINFNKLNLLLTKRRPPSLNELTLIISNTGLTHLGSEASK